MPVKSQRNRLADAPSNNGVRLIRKYGNRRLYDTGDSRYVTLEDLVGVFAGEEEVRVVDAVSGEDLTKRVLAHAILFEEQRRDRQILPTDLLRALLRSSVEPARATVQKELGRVLAELVRGQSRPKVAPTPTWTASVEPAEPQGELAELRRRLRALERQMQRR